MKTSKHLSFKYSATTRLSLIFVLILNSCLTPIKVMFSETDNLSVVYDDVAGLKDELYVKANAWMVSAFNNAKSVIQYQDKEAGTIMGKYLMHGGIGTQTLGGTTTTSEEIYAIIEIRIKDNKAKLDIKPQSQWTTYSDGMSNYGYTKTQAINDMKKLSESFHSAMLKKHAEF